MAVSCAPEAGGLSAREGETADFSAAAGPLPPEVARQVAAACLDWHGGSVLSLAFGSADFRVLMQDARERLTALLDLPDTHDVLFLQGGASAQFALLPQNIGERSGGAAYLLGGLWSARALQAARPYLADVREIALASDDDLALPWFDPRRVAYLHLTANETANGTRLPELPEASVPLAVDMTADLFSRQVPWARIGVGYAAMQKAIGVAGLTCVFVRRDLLGRAAPTVPRVFDYAAQVAASSCVNTPPGFALFVARALLGWLEGRGGLAASVDRARTRAARIYAVLDASPGVYRVAARGARRSLTSICFDLRRPGDMRPFGATLAAHALRGLEGHAAVGGFRAAVHVGTSDAAVDRLCAALSSFAEEHAA